ncbi:MAG: hypothetical protein IJF40_08015 [Clostridia bacterium]|nr:hypothetical protein [Clostridia bacterium]
MEKYVENETIISILQLYGFDEKISEQKSYIHYIGKNKRIKIIFRVTLKSGRMFVIKILRERKDIIKERQKIESQSIFSEFMRSKGIKTPARHSANGKYCNEFIYHRTPCHVTVEDWCGEEIEEITTDIAYQIGELMAQMHILSLDNKCEIGCGTLFSAAYENDVDAYSDFCKICKNRKLDGATVKQIKTLREEKLERIRKEWDTLPKSAVQGDISVNNLVLDTDGLTVFDYNNAGDEVLVSDLILEGLLTAYEMDLPDGVPESYREEIFPAFLKGYLSVRPLSDSERDIAWDIYTLYHGLWFSRVLHRDDCLEALVKKHNYEAANKLLHKMLTDMTESNNGMFAQNA